MRSYESPEPLEDDELENDALDGDPNPDRPIAEWLDDIGPEDMEPDEVMEELEANGFDLIEEDDFVSNPTFPSDQPDWSDELDAPTPMEAALSDANERYAGERPAEDEAIDEMEAEQHMRDGR